MADNEVNFDINSLFYKTNHDNIYLYNSSLRDYPQKKTNQDTKNMLRPHHYAYKNNISYEEFMIYNS